MLQPGHHLLTVTDRCCDSACLAVSLRPHADQVGEGGQPELLDLGRRHPAGLQGQGAQVLQRRQVVEARVGHPGVGHVQRHQRSQARDQLQGFVREVAILR